MEHSVQTRQQNELREITSEVQQFVTQAGIQDGLALLFVPHTTAAITINENADPDVAHDMLQGLNKLVPLHDNYRHLEGNSAAHIKCSLIGSSEQVIISGGRLQLGTWQGIYFCEFDGPRRRKLQVKLLSG
jgi:secondary thiamine-phosphate synthase enzyme